MTARGERHEDRADGPPTPWARLSGSYLFYFAALGALLPFWTPYLESLGFSPGEIGTLMAVFMGSRVLAPPLAGHLADVSGRPVPLVQLTSVATAIGFAGVLLGTSYAWLMLVTLVFSLAWSATLAPLEALTLGWLGGGTRRYGLVRLWGSIGFIATVVVLGPLVERYGDRVVLPACLAIFVAGAVFALTLPRSGAVRRSSGGAALGRVLRKPAVIALLVVAVLMQASHGPYYTFFSIYLRNHGYGESVIGPLWALGVVAEIGAFLLLARVMTAARARPLLLAAFGLTALRWVLIGSFVDEPAVIVAAQTLHAASYAVFHAVVVHFVHRFFAGGNDVRGQALYGALSYGVGGAIGSWLAGQSWTALGPHDTFLAAAIAPAVGLVVAWRWVHDDADAGTG